MELIFEQQIRQILRGEAISIDHNQCPIPNIKRQNHKDFKPLTKLTIGYIVSGSVFDSSDRVLMIQEAKFACRGEWYLPAGRMEPGENISEGVKREVEEEAGLEFEPTSLISVEFSRASWIRFNFTGKITGGTLKTEAQKDEESLQANWFKDSELRFMKIRANDIFPIIRKGMTFHKTSLADRHPNCLPAIQAHTRLIHRQLITCRDSNNRINILSHRENGLHLPSIFIARDDISLAVSEQLILADAFGESADIVSKNFGLLSLEHCGKPSREHDGMCFTTIVLLSVESNLPVITNDNYEWRVLSDDGLTRDLENRLKDGMCIPVVSFRG